MSTLFLHIGTPKTGTTYIQTSLRMSRDRLAENGLIYPVGSEERGLGPSSWTIGNALRFFESGNMARRTIASDVGKATRGVVLSSVGMVFDLYKDSARKSLHETVNRYGFSDVRLLIYLRNPIEAGVSAWLQKVKKHGCTDDLDTFLRTTGLIPHRMAIVAEVLEYLSVQPNFSTSVLNYSTCKSNILSSVCSWLGVDRSLLVDPEAERVNRSLDPGETLLQLELNRLLGPAANFLGKALTERITDLNPGKPSPSRELQEKIWEETKPWVERVNRFLPYGEELVFDRMETQEETNDYKFNEQQVRVIAEALGGEIRRYWDSESKGMSILRRLKGVWGKGFK